MNRFPEILPLLLPAAILVIPYADLLLAVIRRTRAGLSPFAAGPGAPASPAARHRSLAPAERADHVPVGGPVRRRGRLAVGREDAAVRVRGGYRGRGPGAAADVDAPAALVAAGAAAARAARAGPPGRPLAWPRPAEPATAAAVRSAAEDGADADAPAAVLAAQPPPVEPGRGAVPGLAAAAPPPGQRASRAPARPRPCRPPLGLSQDPDVQASYGDWCIRHFR